MRRAASCFFIVGIVVARLAAQGGIHEIYLDASAAGLIPVSWASQSPTLMHLGVGLQAGLEYDSPISIPLRLELGYLGVSSSRISPTGELYRGWGGMRLALMSGYNFGWVALGRAGDLGFSLLGGGALTAAAYNATALAYAYPSLVLEPRLSLIMIHGANRGQAGGPWIALPLELMFRAGTHSLAPGLCLGWRYRVGAVR